MCNHHHEHSHEHSHGHSHEHGGGSEASSLIKIAAAIVILISALMLDLSGIARFAVFFAAYLTAGYDVLLSAFKNLFKGKVFDENFLMSIATLGAFAIKEYPEAVMVMLLYQIGEYFQDRAVEKSRASITALMDIRPDFANLEKDGKIEKVSPEKVAIGDIIVVKTGEKIPLDGVVCEGKAVVDTSALTGEAVPAELSKGDNALSGCINTNGVIRIEVSKRFEESTVSKILELVEHAGSKKAKTEKFITKFAGYYTPIVVLGAVLISLLPPLFLGAEFSVWFERALTFLVISCPCALVISVPLGFFAGIGGASKNGILVKGSSYLEALSKARTVVFDKTGTLTKGTFKVVKAVPCGNSSAEEVLRLAAMAEAYSNHPIALSLKAAYSKEIDNNLVTEVSEIAGNGVKAKVNGDIILAGNDKLMQSFKVNFAKAEENGTIIYAAKNNEYLGYIVISDEIKEEAAAAIKELRASGCKTVMLTGDAENAAEYTASELGIDEYFAQLLPSDKVDKLEELIGQKPKNSTVIFAGDGINDAPVLTRADAGIAMGGLGSDAAIEAADVVIMDDKVSKIVSAIRISKKTMSIVKQNIAFALIVKALFLIGGALGFVTMWGAVFADVGVTLIAVLNSMRALSDKKYN